MAPIPYRLRRFAGRIATKAGEAIMATSQTVEPSTGSLSVVIGQTDSLDEMIAAEIVSMTLFDLGAQAVGEGDGINCLEAGFGSVEEAEAAGVALIERHDSLVTSVAATQVMAAGWVDAQQAGFSPTTVGPWHIRAPWHDEPDDVEIAHDIVIDPGVAFGHGAHPTTQMTIELMRRHLERRPGVNVVDIGTGTGIAAIIAARSGSSVRAVENDVDAIEVAWHNIERNSVHPFDDDRDRIELLLGDGAELTIDPTDLVIANVTMDVQRLLTPIVSAADHIVISGILAKQVRELQDLYPGHSASTIRTHGEWAAVDFSSIGSMGRKN